MAVGRDVDDVPPALKAVALEECRGEVDGAAERGPPPLSNGMAPSTSAKVQALALSSITIQPVRTRWTWSPDHSK